MQQRINPLPTTFLTVAVGSLLDLSAVSPVLSPDARSYAGVVEIVQQTRSPLRLHSIRALATLRRDEEVDQGADQYQRRRQGIDPDRPRQYLLGQLMLRLGDNITSPMCVARRPALARAVRRSPAPLGTTVCAASAGTCTVNVSR